MTLETTLGRLGISGNMSRVYLAAIEGGPAPVAALIARTGLPKATVYDAVAKLESEGLLATEGASGKRRIVAHDPSIMLEQIEARKQMVGDLLPELRALYNGVQGKPNIRFYEGPDGIRTTLMDTLSCSSGVMYCTYAMAEIMETPGLAWMESYMAQRLERGIEMKVMRSRSRDRLDIWPSSKKEMRELRFSPADVLLGLTMIVYDNRVAIISSKKENYGLVLESEEFSRMLRSMYQAIWSISAPSPFIEDTADDNTDNKPDNAVTELPL